MTHEDLQQIKGLIHTELGEAIENVILPAVEKFIKRRTLELKADVAELKLDVAQLKADVAELKKDVTYIKNNYPDKHYLYDRINELRGDIISWRKKDGARFDQLVAFQHKKGYIAEEEVQLLGDMRGFAPLPLA